MKLIEFVVKNNNDCQIMLIDSNDISIIIQDTKSTSILYTKNNLKYCIYGEYRNLTNRFLYALGKKTNFFDDDIMRPSISVFHNPRNLQIDKAMFDIYQISGFIKSLINDSDLKTYINNLDPYTLKKLLDENLI